MSKERIEVRVSELMRGGMYYEDALRTAAAEEEPGDIIGKTVRAKDESDSRFRRGVVLRKGRTGRILVKWPHETSWTDERDLEVVS